MRALLQDLKLSFRSLKKEPMSAAITSITLALGIGLCTVSFSLVYGVFFRGHDVPEPGRLTLIYRTNPSRDIDFMNATMHDFYDWREQQTSFKGIARYSGGTINISGAEGPERYDGSFVSANIFDVLEVQPILGSTFRPGDDEPGAPMTVVLGYQMWAERYDSDPNVAGQSIKVNGEAATILGVMEDGFRFPQDQEVWVVRRDDRSETTRENSTGFDAFARLKDGVTVEQAELEMALIADRLAQEYPETNEGVSTRFRTFTEEDTGPELVAVFGAMQVATIFVLLIACANVANLLMARATLRTREAAVRTALGASRLRVVLPFFAETTLLAAVGALFGMGIAYTGITLFDNATQGVGKPYYMDFAIDLPIMLFVIGIVAFTAIVAGAAPAWQVLKTDVNATLKDEMRGSSGILGNRLTRVLVTAEIALSCALLVGAGLMIKSIVNLNSFEFPYATESVFTARIGLFETDYPTPESRTQFFSDLTDRLEAMPGAQSVSMTTNLPVNIGGRSIAIEGETYLTRQDNPDARYSYVAPRFFETIDVDFLSGRDFRRSDNMDGQAVAIVNESFARQFFSDRDPIGQRFAEFAGRDSLGDWKTIVGIVPDLRMEGFDPDRSDPWGYYAPTAQQDIRFMSLAVKTAGGVSALGLTPAVREVLRAADPDLPMYNVDSLQGLIDDGTWFYRVFGVLFIAVGAAALFMATVGLYGVLSFSVSRRLKEMGIRMALGASAKDVVRLVVRQGGKQIVIGLGLGLVMAYGVTRVIGILMFEVTPQDPPVFTMVFLTIALVGFLASLIPARRATAVSPIVALRYE